MAALEFDVFISYRRIGLDRTVAIKLQSALESYRTPRRLVRKGLPRRIGQVFLDTSEVSTAPDVSVVIEEALRTSRHLVVVCSPETPSSEWVNREVELFLRHRDTAYVHVLLVGGDPSDDPRASLPRALLRVGLEPLAADVRSTSVAEAKRLLREERLRILASLLGCRFDDLRQREAARRRLRFFSWGTIVSLALLLFAGLSWYSFEQNRLARQRLDEGVRAGTHMVFEIEQSLEPIAEAAEIRQRLVASARELLAAMQSDVEADLSSLELRFGTHIAQGQLHLTRGHIDLAEREYSGALATIQIVASQYPYAGAAHRNLAAAHQGLGLVAFRKGNLNQAVSHFEAAIDAVSRKIPWTYEDALGVENDIVNKADALVELGDLDAAEASYREAQSMLDELDRQYPQSELKRRQQYVLLERFAEVAERRGDLQTSLATIEDALEISAELRHEHPENRYYSIALGSGLEMKGSYLDQMGRPAEAISAYEQSLEARRNALAEDPDSAQLARYVALSLMHIGFLAIDMDEVDSARAACAEAASIYDGLQKLDAANVIRESAESLRCLGDVAELARDPVNEGEYHMQSLEMLTAAMAERPDDAAVTLAATISMERVGLWHGAQGRHADAAELHAKRVEMLRELARKSPRDADLQVSLADAQLDYAAATIGLGVDGEFEHASLEALNTMRGIESSHAHAIRIHSSAAVNLASLELERGSADNALEYLREATRVLERTPSNNLSMQQRYVRVAELAYDAASLDSAAVDSNLVLQLQAHLLILEQLEGVRGNSADFRPIYSAFKKMCGLFIDAGCLLDQYRQEAAAHERAGELDAALERYAAIHEYGEQADVDAARLIGRLGIARILHRQGNYRESEREAQSALLLARTVENIEMQMHAQDTLAKAQFSLGEYDAALGSYVDLERAARDAEQDKWIATALAGQAWTLGLAIRDEAGARSALVKARNLAERIDMDEVISAMNILETRLREKTGNTRPSNRE